MFAKPTPFSSLKERSVAMNQLIYEFIFIA